MQDDRGRPVLQGCDGFGELCGEFVLSILYFYLSSVLLIIVPGAVGLIKIVYDMHK